MVCCYYKSDEKYIPDVERPSDSDLVNFWADISKIKREIGWEPKTKIEEGIKKTVIYYQKMNFKK